MLLPTHPDFSLILQAISASDDSVDTAFTRLEGPEQVTAGQLVKEAYGDLVDGDSLHRAAVARATNAMQAVGLLAFLADPANTLTALWADAFLVGVRFAQSGGHQA